MAGAMTARAALPLVGVLVFVAAAYAIALPGPFEFDDLITVAVDPGARSITAWWADLGRHVRPLTKGSFALTCPLGVWLGNVPLGHRLGNVAIHLATIVALFLLGRRLASTCLPQLGARAASRAALAAAALFGLHPLATEAVSYLSGRSMALGTLLGALSLIAWINARETPIRWGWLGAAIGAWAAVVLARETMAIVPLTWVLWEWARTDRPSSAFSTRRIREIAPLLTLAAGLMLIVAAWLLTHDRYAYLLWMSGLIARMHFTEPSLLVALGYFGESFALLRYPSIDPQVPPTMSLVARLTGTVIVTAAALLAWRARRENPQMVIGIAWAAIWIVPIYLVAIRQDPVSERHFYPAIWGLAFALAVSWAKWTERKGAMRTAGHTLAIFAVVACAGITAVRNSDYRSEVALWEAAQRMAPDKVRVLNNLGVAYMEAGRWDDAQSVLAHAVALDPADDQARDNLYDAHRRRLALPGWVRMPEE
jgi:tetratricopeptide (TPR) repeat protein